MTLIAFSGFVRCSFYPELIPVSKSRVSIAEVFFALTKDFSSGSSYLSRNINKDDQLKADRFIRSKENETNLICYTLLRAILSKKLNKDPHEITYLNGSYGKPGIKDDLLFFNISHTRNSFAIAISEHCSIGIDLEELNENIKFEPIIKRFFSEEEYNYILNSKRKSRDRFFLLWTRKEALLKSIGVGIIPQLSHIEVFRRVNLIHRNSVGNLADVSASGQHYIYSGKMDTYYLSIASPQKVKIILHHLNENNLETYIK